MPKAYDFKSVEERLYQWWEANGWFKPEARPPDAIPFVIAIPPPNVTGELHQGHSLFVALEDLMIRRARMQGRAALWVPGVDHAGIATQLQVEKYLLREEEVTREELGREAFVERVWAWKEKYGSYITDQLRRLGASCDWDRERFTLDEGLSQAVREAFARLYRLGLIYQAEYLVNWSPGLQTAVSDLEVEYHDEEGLLYYFRYPLQGGGHIPVATTRPETILGDTAVAVHPEDERFASLVGRTALVPILGRPIPVIADEQVQRDFGTGALKVTPGHDASDFEIGRRYDLPIVNVMNKDATMSAAAGPYAGLDRFECRRRLWDDMGQAGLILKAEPHMLSVPRSQRGGEIVEPLVSRQWFVNARPQAELALAAVESGRIQLTPDYFVRVWRHWLENIQPWCISRQLWWGHRIPVWTCQACGHQTVAVLDPAECEKCGGEGLEQDPDVLDTWFSSALWPFSSLGWPVETADLKRFYPTDVLETGYDILFFWVARMVMAGTLFTNDAPFHTVFLHGLIRDEQGRKMSKSLGNVVDPLDVMNQFGADALRFTLLTGSTPGKDMNLALAKVESNRNFSNKIWNVTRFVVQKLTPAAAATPTAPAAEDHTVADRWIWSRLNQLIADADRLLDGYQFGEAGRQIHDFFWAEFADWYVEAAKVQLAAGGRQANTTLWMLLQVLDTSLRLLHPYIPFVTEESWQQLKRATAAAGFPYEPAGGWPEALIIANWPMAGEVDVEADQQFERLRDLVRAIRAARSDHQVEPARLIPALVSAPAGVAAWEQMRPLLAALARLDPARLVMTADGLEARAEDTITLALGDVTAYLPLSDLLDVERERERLAAELDEVGGQIERLERLLGGEFSAKAPAGVVAREREKLARFQNSRAELSERLAKLDGR
ncbi:MAG: valine--tRNA ligase [Candidatus Promineifilaceae bacterium]